MNPHAEAHAEKFAEIMARAGYDPTDELRRALMQEFANCLEASAEDECVDHLGDFLEILQYAASAYTRN